MKKIIIVSNEQFGYHTDTYKYCMHTKNIYDIHFICLSHGFPFISDEKIKVSYIKKGNNHKINNLKLLIYSALLINISTAKNIFIMYFRFAHLLKIITPGRKHVLDIRTGVISQNLEMVRRGNKKIMNCSRYFNKVSVISLNLARYLKLNPDKVKLLPLGATINNQSIAQSNREIIFSYVGILSQRNFNDTLKAYLKLKEKYENIKYIIAGYHSLDDEEKKEFFDLIERDSSINYLGRVEHSKVNEILEKSHVGISYVPITEFYNFQPPTKTFEYLANGIPCIATKTYENQLIINEVNGILCDDNVDDLYYAMCTIIQKINQYDSNIIKGSIQEYDWNNIVDKFFIPLID